MSQVSLLLMTCPLHTLSRYILSIYLDITFSVLHPPLTCHQFSSTFPPLSYHNHLVSFTANKRWQDESARADAFLTNTKIKQVRHAKLTELYARDEAMYEQELNERGLAFCREKY